MTFLHEQWSGAWALLLGPSGSLSASIFRTSVIPRPSQCMGNGDDQEKVTVDKISPQAMGIDWAISDVDSFRQSCSASKNLEGNRALHKSSYFISRKKTFGLKICSTLWMDMVRPRLVLGERHDGAGEKRERFHCKSQSGKKQANNVLVLLNAVL